MRLWKGWCEMAYPLFTRKIQNAVLGPFDGGIMLESQENELPEGKSPEIINMIYENGVLRKREGLKKLFKNSDEEITACFRESYYGYIIYACGGSVKAYSIKDGSITVLKKNLPGKRGCFFIYNGRVYYMGDGGYFKIEYSDEKLLFSEVEGYIPTVYINCSCEGIGDKDEEFNLLTGKYKASYSTEEGMSYVILPHENTELSAGVIVEYNGEILEEDKYEISSERKITFKKSFTPGHNNLVITASVAENKEDREKIAGCTTAEFFGGSSSGLSEGTRVFVAGNEKYANTFFRSALKNPEYFPLSGFEILGDVYDPITCFGKQGGALIIFKKNSIYMSFYEYSSGEVIFTVTNISHNRGCDRPLSLASASNRLIWFHSRYGVMCLASVSPQGQKNAVIISGNINGGRGNMGLMTQNNENIAAFVYKERYCLSTEKYCYILDLKYGFGDVYNCRSFSWYIFTGFKATGSVFHESGLYIATEGECFASFEKQLYDFDEANPIKATYTTPAADFGSPFYFKTVLGVKLQLRADCNSYFKVTVYDEDGKLIPEKEYRINKLSFVNFSFGKFTFKNRTYATVVKLRAPGRRTKFLTVKLENHLPASDMAVSAVAVEYITERGVKYNGI